MALAGPIVAGLFLLAALYCGTDPFNHRPMAKFPGFEVYPVELPPWSELPAARDAENRLQKAELRFVNQVQGPESITFDPLGRGPYTGVADGRILFWNGESWSDFAYTSQNRSGLCDPKPSLFSYLENEHICGRPLGLRFNKKTGDLYIADAYFGLLKVGPEGGVATPLTTEAEGVPFKFTNDLDIDEDGSIYFTDSSFNFQRSRNLLPHLASLMRALTWTANGFTRPRLRSSASNFRRVGEFRSLSVASRPSRMRLCEHHSTNERYFFR
ncbi:Strictosidine synthase 1 [Dendrobium catenatum]|uniref:Strictosidine synthase 1 n=1 Tax=Dendrobium catenatum TaxID=906689 RepID=A0A2I0V762_9ASPA|nr:Strictosidine synthase 1 [Dendrobium catenatum]